MSELLKTVEEQVRPEHAAVIVIDMQNDFCAEDGWIHKTRGGEMSENKTIAANIDRLAATARHAGMPVIWVRAIYDFKYLPPAHIAKRGREGCCLEGSWGADFFEIAPADGEPVIDKHTYNAFHGTNLETELAARGIKTLVMTGVATNVCVDSTLREGFFRGYNIVVAEDCVGSYNRAGHEGTLSTVRNNFGSVVPSSEIIGLLQDRAA
jgi:ureidoacrylate peracid hydrolase